MRLDFRRHFCLRNRLGQIRQLGIAALRFTQLFLDRFQLLAQQEFALPLIHALLGLLVDPLRQAQYFDAMHQQIQYLVEPFRQIERFKDVLLFLWRQVHDTSHEISVGRCRRDVLCSRCQFRGYLRQQAEDFGRTLFELQQARLDFRRLLVGFRQQLHTRRIEWIAVQKFDGAKALMSLAYDVMHIVLRRDVTQDTGSSADLVQLPRLRHVGAGVALQNHPYLDFTARRLLRSGDGALASDIDGRHQSGKQH